MQTSDNILVDGLILAKLLYLLQLVQSVNPVNLVQELVVLRLIGG